MKEVVRVIKFVLFSASAGVIQMGSFALFEEVFHWAHWLAYLVALVLSVIWNFTLNRKFTFKSNADVPTAMMKVAAYYAVFTPATTLLEHYLIPALQANATLLAAFGASALDQWVPYAVTALNMILNLVTEFLYDRFVVFRGTIDKTL